MDGYVTYRNYYVDDELAHHGILGPKWGVRRYQNEDGTLTEEGKKRYGTVGKLKDAELCVLVDKWEKDQSIDLNYSIFKYVLPCDATNRTKNKME